MSAKTLLYVDIYYIRAMVKILYSTENGELLKCKDCGHTWYYTGSTGYAICPQCDASNNLHKLKDTRFTD